MRILLGAVIATISAFVTVQCLDVTYDDAFITYRYAYNLASGHGFVYNPGERILSTSAPLYGLLLAFFGFLVGPDSIPLCSAVISGASVATLCYCFLIFASSPEDRFSGMVAALLLCSSSLLPLFMGGEMPFLMALSVGGFMAYRKEHPKLCSVLMALAALTRLDAILAFLVVCVHSGITNHRLPWRKGLTFLLVVLPFVAISYWYYGSLFPHSMFAKLGQRETGLWVSFAEGLMVWTPSLLLKPGSSYLELKVIARAILIASLAVAGIHAMFTRSRFWLLPVAWMTLHGLVYSIAPMPFYHWYAAPVYLGLLLLLSCGIASGIHYVIKTSRFSPAFTGTICLLIVLVIQLPDVWKLRSTAEPSAVDRLYHKTGVWMETNTPPDASVGYLEIGRIGYYSKRRIIDPLGLFDPAALENLENFRLPSTYERFRPDYILYNEAFSNLLDSVLTATWFQQQYKPVIEISENGYKYPLVIYAKTH